VARTVIVTGGAQGIGLGVADRLLGDGWRVVLADVDAEAGAEAVQRLGPDRPVSFVTCDVADEASVADLVGRATADGDGLDGLVTSAGLASAHGDPVQELALADWQRVLAVNLTGTMLCVKHAVAHLRAAGGSVVTIASTRAHQAEPHNEAYAASKGGVVALTRALAVSLGPDVRVNCISPGWIEVGRWKKASARREPDHSPLDRGQHPVGRVGEPGDVAGLAAWLLSEQAGFVTGQDWIVDGGMAVRMRYAE
jgi:NAD(P)-dependent dehydrogenase (short-subunit alcohol dehydrogenase family)